MQQQYRKQHHNLECHAASMAQRVKMHQERASRSRSPLVVDPPCQPEGHAPPRYEALHCWPEHIIQRLGADSFINKKVVITTHYSGLGCAEVAASVAHAFLQHAGVASLDEPSFFFHSACDNDRVCQDVLSQHRLELSTPPPPHKPPPPPPPPQEEQEKQTS